MYDILIIGSGPAGYVAAIRAAQLGMKVACIEKGFIGGTCLNIGCIPSKTLLDSSLKHYQLINDYAEHGIEAKEVQIDLSKMMSRKEGVVKQLTDGVEALLKSNKVDLINGSAKILGNSSVEVVNDEGSMTLEAKNIMIATGSYPSELEKIKIGNNIVDNEGALKFKKVPQSIVVVGAGVIGLELGSLWSRLGSKVTIIEAQAEFLPMLDQRISRQVFREFINQGLDIKLGCEILEVKEKSAGLEISFNYKNEQIVLEPEKIILAVGRKPNTTNLNLEAIGVELDEKKRIKTNKTFQTNIKNVYAIGDVIEGPMLAHKAEDEGIAVAENIAGQSGHVNYDTIPGVVYTTPEVASIGKTEEQLKELNTKYKIGKFSFMANSRAKAIDNAEGFVKILADETTDKVLGAHIIGPHAGELIAEIGVAMEFGASSEDIARTCHAHPTFSEAVKEAALSVDKRAIHS